MALTSPPHKASFRLFGFPIRVKLSFFIIAFLLFGRNDSLGLRWVIWSVVAYGSFMLIHELGHAFAARRFGCTDVAISLDFLVGYAMFRPPAGITKRRLAVISAAGPVAEIVTGLGVLVAMGASLTSFDSMRHGMRGIVLWFGPVLGLANLLPILPLDGGNIAALGLEQLLPGRGKNLYQRASLVFALAIAAAGLYRSRGGEMSALVLPGVMLVMMNLSGFAGSARSTTSAAPDPTLLAAAAEDQSWHGPLVVPFPQGTSPSPWVRAHHALLANDPGGAQFALGQSVSAAQPYWHLSDDAPHDALLRLVEHMPSPARVDDLHGARTYHHVLHRLGFLRQAADYGARVYTQHQDSFTAHQVATELALLGHADHAVAWVRTALADPAERSRLSDHGLDSIRNRPDFGSLSPTLPPPRV